MIILGEAGQMTADLPGTEIEVHDLGTAFSGVTILRGNDLDRPSLVRAIQTANVVHFIGHGRESFTGTGLLVRRERPDRPEIVLDSSLLDSLTLPHTKLAVLSACSTARGQRGILDPDSLVQGFLRAGANKVVASRWQVDSVTTAHFMSYFYHNLAQGESVEAALAGSSDLIRTTIGEHPFYWAAFSAFE